MRQTERENTPRCSGFPALTRGDFLGSNVSAVEILQVKRRPRHSRPSEKEPRPVNNDFLKKVAQEVLPFPFFIYNYKNPSGQGLKIPNRATFRLLGELFGETQREVQEGTIFGSKDYYRAVPNLLWS